MTELLNVQHGFERCSPKNRLSCSYVKNIAPDINNHLRSIDLFRSMIIQNRKSKVRDDHPPLPASPYFFVFFLSFVFFVFLTFLSFVFVFLIFCFLSFWYFCIFCLFQRNSQNLVRMQSQCSHRVVKIQSESSQIILDHLSAWSRK